MSFLDNLLSNADLITANMTISFGPGIFETKGFGSQSANAIWFPRSGQRFIGSGINQTILRLVKAQAEDSSLNRGWMAPFYSVEPLAEVEISDMTIDCNLARQPALDHADKPNRITVSAIVFSIATQTSIRRVRVINWGPHTPTIVNGNVGEDLAQECFPIYIDPPYPPPEHPNNVVEDCIWEQPDLCPARESTLVNAKAIPMATVRNCYFNCDMTTGQAQPVISVLKIDYTASEVTLRTKWPHNMRKGDEVLIAGSPVASFNSRFQLDFDPPDYMTLKFSKSGSSGEPNGPNVTAERHVPVAMLIDSITSSGGVATLVTKVAHRRLTDDYIRVSGAEVNGGPDNAYNGSFKATRVNDTTLTYPIGQSLAAAAGEMWLDRWSSAHVVITGVQEHDAAPGDQFYEATYDTAGPALQCTRRPGPCQGDQGAGIHRRICESEWVVRSPRD